ncbi:MarR family transcriptional regulator [Ferrovum sp.]|jgi:predicted transcriptional regulator|uniref:HVO_A0114 family putative DNA-binding protein n=1 Tax=Ferrovum sp. TaxID=2609467 RepID=UPI0026323AB4|nr:MarR family transcriptional regulator [Ferrovum sp.]
MTIVIVATQEKIRAQVLNIVTGKHPQQDSSRVYFSSMVALSKILNDDNLELLRLIKRHEPESIAELAELTGHKQKTLTKQLDTLSRYGFVALFQEEDTITPVSTLDWIKIAVL